MSEWQFIIVIILQVAMPIVITLCFKFLGAYSSKKGENLAVIEDNKKIISEIESIKLEFAKLQESDRSQKNLIVQRLVSHNSKIDDLLFQLLEDSDKLFNELRIPDPNIVGYSKNNRIAWVVYFKGINSLINSIITKRPKLSVFFCKDDEIIKSAEYLICPSLKATTALSKIDVKISNMQSDLIKEYVYSDINGETKVNDASKLTIYLEHLHNLLIEQVELVYKLQAEFENAKQIYLSKVQSYYEYLRDQINVR